MCDLFAPLGLNKCKPNVRSQLSVRRQMNDIIIVTRNIIFGYVDVDLPFQSFFQWSLSSSDRIQITEVS